MPRWLRLNEPRRALMAARIAAPRRRARASGSASTFLDPGGDDRGNRASRVQDARDGRFERQRDPGRPAAAVDPGHGPGRAGRTRPSEQSLRNVAYALLSGADGWMFDGEDALGQVSTMSLDNQRNLKLAIARDPVFLQRRRAGRRRDERVGRRASSAGRSSPTGASSSTSRPRSSAPRGLHLDDRHVRAADGTGFSASIVDAALYVVNNHAAAARGRRARSSSTCRRSRPPRRRRSGTTSSPRSRRTSACRSATIKVYVLVEQLEACFQLMEIRAALGRHFVGFNTGRWDYINSVSDAMAWDPAFVNPNIDAITMTYGYMRNYEDRVRRAVNTPDRDGPLRAVAGRHGAEHPGGLGGGRRGGHEAGGRRRRARAARGRQRQVGRALEDGAHRPAGVGEGGRRPISSAARSRRSPTPRRTPTA